MTAGVEGLRVVVTGGATGIGAGITSALLEGGASVCVIQRTDDELRTALAESGLRGQVDAIVADLSNVGRCLVAIQDATSALGGLDALVNNAAVTGPAAHRALLEIDAEHLDRIVDLNIKGVIACSTAAARHMSTHGGGTILSISSVLAYAPAPQTAVYSASKAALLGFTRGLALEMGSSGVRALTLSPGDITTPTSVAPPSDGDRDVRQAALGRRGEPGDIGDVADVMAQIA